MTSSTPAETAPASIGARIWRAADAVMLLAFIASVAVQFNDPDPLRWVLIYGAAALASFQAFAGRIRFPLPVLVGMVALVWAGDLAPRVLGSVPFKEMFGAWEMSDAGVEEAREFYGLLLIAVWMLILAGRARFASWRAAKASSTDSASAKRA